MLEEFLLKVNSMGEILGIFLIMILTFTTLGILLGSKYSKNISSNFLKKAFGFFLIIVSIVIILKEIIRNNII